MTSTGLTATNNAGVLELPNGAARLSIGAEEVIRDGGSSLRTSPDDLAGSRPDGVVASLGAEFVTVASDVLKMPFVCDPSVSMGMPTSSPAIACALEELLEDPLFDKALELLAASIRDGTSRVVNCASEDVKASFS